MKDRDAVRDLLKRLLMVVSVVAVSEREIQNALNLAWGDFEDSVQYSVALLNEMDGIVTRNPSDYQEANMRIWLPEQALELFANEGPPAPARLLASFRMMDRSHNFSLRR